MRFEKNQNLRFAFLRQGPVVAHVELRWLNGDISWEELLWFNIVKVWLLVEQIIWKVTERCVNNYRVAIDRVSTTIKVDKVIS